MLVTNVVINSAQLNWASSAGVFYTVDYKEAASAIWINASTAISNGPVTLLNLIGSTTYDVRVSANCSAIPVNNYSSLQFTTSSHNNQITNLKGGYGIKISPNPVNKKAIIDYIIAESGNVSITVINPQGQRLQTLLETSQAAGQYQLSITHELDKLSKGIYFLWLRQNKKGNVVRFIKY